jgi:hypothetical protein
MMISSEQATKRFSSSLPQDGNLQYQILKGVCNEQRRSSSTSAARFQGRLSSFMTMFEVGGDADSESEAVDLNTLARLKRKEIMTGTIESRTRDDSASSSDDLHVLKRLFRQTSTRTALVGNKEEEEAENRLSIKIQQTVSSQRKEIETLDFSDSFASDDQIMDLNGLNRLYRQASKKDVNTDTGPPFTEQQQAILQKSNHQRSHEISQIQRSSELPPPKEQRQSSNWNNFWNQSMSSTEEEPQCLDSHDYPEVSESNMEEDLLILVI